MREKMSEVSEESPVPETIEEFFEQVVGSGEPAAKAVAPMSYEGSPSPNEQPFPLSSVTQYVRHGHKYAFTGETAKILPPGVYDIDFNNQLGWHVEQKALVTDELLRLPDSQSDAVVAEVDKFWGRKPIFKRFGYVHKRGFLLWGPPGSGKTSTIALITKSIIEDKKGLVIIGAHPAGLSVVLQNLRRIEPDRSIVVILEDIDTIIKQHGESNVLAILDGENSIDNVVFVATTNYPEDLDGRVVNRPSRFDKVVKIGMPSAEARTVYLKSRGIPEEDVAKIVAQSEGMSVAHLKEIIVSVYCLGDAMSDVVERLKKMAKAPKSSGAEGPVGFGSK